MIVTLNSQESFFRHQSSSLTSFTPQDRGGPKADDDAKAGQLLHKILAEKVTGSSNVEGKHLDPGAFSPEKVAGRIADFVAKGLEQARRDGKSEEQVQALYDEALQGIEKGFSEAYDILEEMNLLTDTIANTIDTTFDLAMEALDQLDPGFNSDVAVPSSTSMYGAERYSSAESFSLDLRTQDGDKVSINFASASSYEASFGAYQDGNGAAASFSIDRSQSSDYRFSVEGDLDEDELKAIQDLIQDVSLIADDFFDGDVQAAFEQASEFQMDKTELSSMHLTLTRSEQYSVASAYQQVQDLGSDRPDGRKLGHMMNDLAGRFSHPGLGFLEQPLDFGQSLLQDLIPQDSRYQNADDEQQSRYDHNLQRMQDILSGLVGDDQDE